MKNQYQKIAKELRKLVTKDFGQKCEEYGIGCFACEANRIVEGVEALSNLVDR